jgi:hypothetical protein
MRKLKIVACLMAALIAVVNVSAKDKLKVIDPSDYEISGAGSGTEGTCLVKVFVYGSGSDAAIKVAAVHGVIFRGFSGTSSGASQPAMASPSVEETHLTFFKSFLDEKGACQNYANIVPGSYERVKTAKGKKVGAVVQVMRSALRHELEQQGVIKSLSSGF